MMPEKSRMEEDELASLFDALGESVVMDVSDEEFFADLREAGEDPDVLAETASEIIRQAIRARADMRRRQIRESYETSRAAIATRKHSLPATVPELRALLSTLIARNPGIRSAVTLHHRELRELSDADVRGYLEKLAELGFLVPSLDFHGAALS